MNMHVGGATKFKVGDRVRRKGAPNRGAKCIMNIGDVGSVSRVFSDGWIEVDGYDLGMQNPSYFELAEPALQLAAGKFYKTRDGRKVGPMNRYAGGWSPDGGHHMYRDNGERYFRSDRGGPADIIAEWVDEVAAGKDRPFKVGDLVDVKYHPSWDGRGKIVSVHHGFATVKFPRTGPYDEGGFHFRHLTHAPADAYVPTADQWIVCLIEDGQPKPADTPHVHRSEYSATKEADRLAGVFVGKEFGIYKLTGTVRKDPPTYAHEWQRLAKDGRKIAAIKELSGITGLGLWAAKDSVENWLRYN